jgi:hypothetical protein
MRIPSRFRAETQYVKATEKKANVNLPMMAAVGNGDGATFRVAGRDNFYWVRLINDANRLTQCFSPAVALAYDDYIYVAKASDRKLTYYEFVSFIQASGGETSPILNARGIIIPDNVAQGFYIEDDDSVGAGTPEYLRIVTTDGSQAWVLNEGGADVDFRVEAVGISDAIEVRGNDGQITLGVLVAGLLEANAGGVVTSDYTVNSTVTMASGQDIDPTDASGQDLGDATHRWDLYTQDVIFGGASGTNIVTVPDNVADALHVIDAGGQRYWEIVSTNTNPHVLHNTLLGGPVFGFVVKNTSGGAATVGDVGYIDSAGEYKTIATANSAVAWCVVVVGGANNADIYVARRGRVTVTLNGNCAIGDYLYTSTTAGQAQPQSYVRSEVFAVALTANAAGAGGTCSALLLCHSIFVTLTSGIPVWRVSNHADTDFVAKIDDNAGAHGGTGLAATTVPYDTVTAGNENVLNTTAGQHAKVGLYNLTRATWRLIDSVDMVNDVINTVASADAWADNDDITIRSQTVTTAHAARHVELDFSQSSLPVLARALFLQAKMYDSGAAGEWLALHPIDTYAGAKEQITSVPVAGQWEYDYAIISLVNRRCAARVWGSGAATASHSFDYTGYWLAVP